MGDWYVFLSGLSIALAIERHSEQAPMMQLIAGRLLTLASSSARGLFVSLYKQTSIKAIINVYSENGDAWSRMYLACLQFAHS